MDGFNGIVHLSPNGEAVHLPLEELRAKVIIVDVSAQVILTQVFSNDSQVATTRAKYVFPVPARSAVCAFEMQNEDGRIVTGVVKERSLAKEEYENALRDGRTTGLLEWVTDDVFTISVGSIPANQRVTTKLTYVMDLMEDEIADQVRFHIPMCVGDRYGTPPPSLADAASPSSRTRLRITTDIQTSGRILRVDSPTHSDEISLVPYLTHSGRASRRRMTVKFRSKKFLDRGFVLSIQAEGLDEPRCFAELDHAANGNGADTLALQLTIVPKFDFPPIPAQEYLFLVDRSGSMAGQAMETAKRTLAMLLYMLPSQDTTFNVFSFGSQFSSLWPRSAVYAQDSLDAASTHVDNMEANYGGTEMLQALEFVVTSRKTNVQTSVFVLTDGWVHDEQMTECTAIVTAAVAAAAPATPLRVFALGIGSNVSTALCDNIARAGNGASVFAVASESIVGKCASLLRAGKAPSFENVTIDWGVPVDNPNAIVGTRSNVRTSTQRVSSSTSIQLPPPSTVQQSPAKIHRINPGIRFNVFAIITLKKKRVPRQVTLRGTLDGGGGGPFEVTVPITSIQVAGAETRLPLVHTLAARRLVTDIEHGRAPLQSSIGATENEVRTAMCVRLGEKYQLAGRYTSFVAVDYDMHTRRNEGAASSSRRRPSARASRSAGPSITSHSQSLPHNIDAASSASQGSLDRLLGFVASVFSGFLTSTTPSSRTRRSPPGRWREQSSRSSSSSLDEADDPPARDEVDDNAYSFSTMSSLEGSLSDWSDWTPPPSPRVEETAVQRTPSPPLRPIHLAPDSTREQFLNHPPRQAATLQPAPVVRTEVFSLVRLQRFDGSFPLNNALGAIVGQEALVEVETLQADDRSFWATALAVAYFMKHLRGQPDLVDNLLQKITRYVSSHGYTDFDQLVQRAGVLVV